MTVPTAASAHLHICTSDEWRTSSNAQPNDQIVCCCLHASQRTIPAVGRLCASQGIQNGRDRKTALFAVVVILVQLVNLNKWHSLGQRNLLWARPCLHFLFLVFLVFCVFCVFLVSSLSSLSSCLHCLHFFFIARVVVGRNHHSSAG
jgi:hypothetical protein